MFKIFNKKQNFTKKEKVEKKINFSTILLISAIVLFSYILREINYDSIKILKDNWILNFLKEPSKPIALLGFFKSTIIFENKKSLNETVSVKVKEQLEKEKHDLESEREACL